MPDWILPIKAMLNRFGLCNLKILMCLGPGILKQIVLLLREENMFFLANTVEIFLATKTSVNASLLRDYKKNRSPSSLKLINSIPCLYHLSTGLPFQRFMFNLVQPPKS